MRWALWGLAAVAVSTSGCAPTEPANPTAGPDAVQVRVYTNGGERSPESVRWRFASVGSPDQEGVVTWIPEGTCIHVGPQWTLRVTTDAGAEPILNAVATSANFGGKPPVSVAIERTPEGRVTISEGLPDWWDGDRPIGCASD